MWETEHGQQGNDELNLIEKGGNYGWPTIQGDKSLAGMHAPVITSGPDVTWAPAGMAFANGKLFFAGLRGTALYEVTPQADGTVTDLQAHFEGTYGRLRAVTLSPDGDLLITTSNRDGRGSIQPGDDKILKVHPSYFRN
jgi:glucose/arabinose dehydrogenase